MWFFGGGLGCKFSGVASCELGSLGWDDAGVWYKLMEGKIGNSKLLCRVYIANLDDSNVRLSILAVFQSQPTDAQIGNILKEALRASRPTTSTTSVLYTMQIPIAQNGGSSSADLVVTRRHWSLRGTLA